jgi:hypothetical protein
LADRARWPSSKRKMDASIGRGDGRHNPAICPALEQRGGVAVGYAETSKGADERRSSFGIVRRRFDPDPDLRVIPTEGTG